MIRTLICSGALLFTQVAAAAPAQRCLTPDEVGNLVVFVAPSAIEASAKQCASSLAEGAFLRGAHRELAERLRSEARTRRAEMRTILGKLTGEKMPEGIRDETLQSLLEDVIGAEFGKEMKPQHCAAVDRLASSIAPLPAQNIGALMASMTGFAKEDGKKSSFQMCRSS